MATNNKLENILTGLEGDFCLEKSVTKTVSVRLPVIDLARIDVLAGMKDVSRNILLNDILDAALTELMEKLAQKNPQLAQKLNKQAAQLAEKLLSESDTLPHKKGPKHKPKHKPKDHEESE